MQKLANDALIGQPAFEEAFRQGMAQCAGDRDHGGGQDYGDWEPGRDREQDVMLIIASDTESKLDGELKNLV